MNALATIGTERSFLTDTNSAIARINQNAAIITVIENADRIFIPSIVLGELYFGAEKSAKVEENLAAIEKFVARGIVLPCDAQTARLYGSIAYKLRKRGRPIPVNDTWIAALALQYGLTLLTRDAHFKYVDDLSIETW